MSNTEELEKIIAKQDALIGYLKEEINDIKSAFWNYLFDDGVLHIEEIIERYIKEIKDDKR